MAGGGIAATPGPSGEPVWSYPDAFNMPAETCLWKARFRPRFDRRVETGMTQAASEDGLDALTAGGSSAATGVPGCPIFRANDTKPEYHDGDPLNTSELREMGAHSPVKNGVLVGCDRSSWAGCGEGTKRIFQHSMIKLANLHW